MKLAVEVHPDHKGSVQVIDQTYNDLHNGYLDEDADYIEDFSWDKFKWSDSCTIDIFTKITSCGESLEDARYIMHKYIDRDGIYRLLEADSVRFHFRDDGYYALDHIILPTRDSNWYEEAKRHMDDDGAPLLIYVVERGPKNIIYKYSDGKETPSCIKDVIREGIYVYSPELNTYVGNKEISMRSFSLFSTDRLSSCYKKTACNILDNLKHCGLHYARHKFIMDLLRMALFVIDTYIHDGQYSLAQLILEKLGRSNGFYSDDESSVTTSSCGCLQ